MRATLLVLALLACTGTADPEPAAPGGGTPGSPGTTPAGRSAGSPGAGGPPPPEGAPQGGLPAGEGFADPGGQHPPIPAENPVWEWDAGGFVSDARWYGEHNWADVRMRVAGHVSAAGRDRGRVLASQGDLTAAATAYADLARRLDGVQTPADGIAREIVAPLQRAAHRDAALLGTLAAGGVPDVSGSGLDALRARYLGLAVRHERGEDVAADARSLQADLTRHLAVDADLDIDAFTDFDDRHALRVALVEAYLAALDPLGLDERWGYWRPTETRRQALLIGLATGRLGAEDWAWKVPNNLVGEIPSLAGVPAMRWPSVLAEALHDPDQAPDFTADGLGWLPTGDTLIDTGGWPGPRAIGTLERLGLDDPEHHAQLETWATGLDAALAEDPGEVPAEVAQVVDVLNAHGHGSRFYNIKQVRNDAVRQLARAGHADLALRILRTNRPLHHQDWSCPNRDGILRALEGRLQAEAGDEAGALRSLEQAVRVGSDFLRDVDAAERAGPGRGPGKRPPAGPGGPGAHGAPGTRQGGPHGGPPGQRGVGAGQAGGGGAPAGGDRAGDASGGPPPTP
jgi:hypothetical protein